MLPSHEPTSLVLGCNENLCHLATEYLHEQAGSFVMLNYQLHVFGKPLLREQLIDADQTSAGRSARC